MRILYVEGCPDDAQLVREAVHEMEETRRWRQWVRNVELVHLERLDEAVAVLAEERFDAVLAGSILPDAQGIEILLALRAQAPEVPVIFLVPDDDDAFAISAVREGADDCLPLAQLEGALLARALRKSVERRRWAEAARRAVQFDPETGLLSRDGFLAAAARDLELARRLNRTVFLAVASIEGQANGSCAEALETAAALRLSFAGTDLIARLDARRFAVLSICADTDDVPDSLAALARYIAAGNRERNGRRPLAIRLGTVTEGPAEGRPIEVLLNRAEMALCENGPSVQAAFAAARRATA